MPCMVNFIPRPLYHWGMNLVPTEWGGWVGLRFGLDSAEKNKILPCHESNPCRLVHSMVTTDFFTSALDGSEWPASHPGHALPPRKRNAGTHWIGGWVGLRAGLHTEVGGKILCLCKGSNPDRPVIQSVVRHYTDWATPAHIIDGRILKTAKVGWPHMTWSSHQMSCKSINSLKSYEGERDDTICFIWYVRLSWWWVCQCWFSG
jgi:hypothetical protein